MDHVFPIEQYPVPEHVYESYCNTLANYTDPSDPSMCCSYILLYIILDTLGQIEYAAFAKNTNLNTTTSKMIMDYWAIDNFQLDVSSFI